MLTLYYQVLEELILNYIVFINFDLLFSEYIKSIIYIVFYFHIKMTNKVFVFCAHEFFLYSILKLVAIKIQQCQEAILIQPTKNHNIIKFSVLLLHIESLSKDTRHIFFII
jgi:hypothetical protein